MHKPPISSELLPDNPWRPVDARYRRAREILRNGGRTTRRDDSGTATVLGLLRRLSACRNQNELAALRRQKPHGCLALQFYAEASLGRRSVLEARLLAGEPRESIAKKTGLTRGAVDLYAQAFFDVESRRGRLDFIMHCAIGDPGRAETEEEFTAVVTKTVAHFGGWKMLDEILYPGSAAAREGLTAFEVLARYFQDQVKTKAAMAVCCMRPADRADRRELLRLQQRIRQDEEREDEGLSTFERHAKAMLEEFPWLVGPGGRAGLPLHIAAYDDEATELRADELMKLAAEGELPAALAEEVQGLSFPLPGSGRPSPAPPRPPDGPQTPTDHPAGPSSR